MEKDYNVPKQVIDVNEEQMLVDLTTPQLNVLSPRDPLYAIEFFSNSIKCNLLQSETIAQSIYDFVLKESPIALQYAESTKKGCRYVVDATDKTIEAINKGKIKLVTEKGKLRAQIRQSDGLYGPKLDIKKEEFNQPIDPVQMANSLQLKALQEQLQEMTNQIAAINSSVIDVLQGQQNDRIALFYSGVNLYLESQTISDPDLKKQLASQAIRALSDGTQQLTLTMEHDIEYLRTKQYDKLKGKKKDAIQEKIDSINKAFGFIHQASLARAAIYCEQNELLAMTNVLSEYSRFIETTVAQNSNLLAQADKQDDGTVSGIWSSRANLKLDVTELKKELYAPNKTLFLSIEGNENEN